MSKKKEKPADHVRMHDGGQSFKCHHCGEVHRISYPMEIKEFANKANGFTDLHRDCKTPEAGK